jgi:hypothetical protein
VPVYKNALDTVILEYFAEDVIFFADVVGGKRTRHARALRSAPRHRGEPGALGTGLALSHDG